MNEPERAADNSPQVDMARFYAFIEEAVSEIARRDRDYLSLFPIVLPDPRVFARRNSADPRSCGLSGNETAMVLEAGNRYLGSKYETIEGDEGMFFAEWIAATVIDAYQAAGHVISLEVIPESQQSVRDVFQRDYDFASTGGGAGYYVRRKGALPVVLVNATGLPIEVWQRLLVDAGHGYKLIVPSRPHGDLFEGGIQSDVRLEDEASGIVAIVEKEAREGVHILAWCNGARLAVEVAARLGDRAVSLTLLAPMFKGIRGIRPSPTPYGRDLQLILDLVGKDPETARMFARRILETANPIDWSKVSGGDARQSDEIFRLPNRRHLERLLKPLLSPDSLVNVARRVASDERHPTLERLSILQVPVMVILGTHDTIVSNRTTLDAMQEAGCRSVNLSVLGAGHDIHDLQYRYLRYALSYFVDRRQPPVPSARMRVLGAAVP